MLSLLKYEVSSSILFPIRIKKQLQNPYFKLYQVICKRMAYFESELLFTAFIIFFYLVQRHTVKPIWAGLCLVLC